MYRRIILLVAICFGSAVAGPLPYNESADAKAEVRQALAEAGHAKLPVLIVFGANWCEDCRALDASLKTGRNADLIARSFKVVKVDVGNFNRNLDLSAAYGDPIKKGIPAAVVLSAQNQVLYVTRAGELSSARTMSETGVYEFFSRAANVARVK